ncbi:MAG: hypothetical protein GC154_06220 [bacterium]|nr:hypothetical protein [bacterium]
MLKRISAIFVMSILIASGAWSQVLMNETFDDVDIFAGIPLNDEQTGQPITDPATFEYFAPSGWTATSEMRPEEDGFTEDFPFPCLTVMELFQWVDRGNSRDLAVNERDVDFFDGNIVMSDSDSFGDRGYRTWFRSPVMENVTAPYVRVKFASHYKHNDNQIAALDYRWDGGDWQRVFEWSDANRSDNQDYLSVEKHIIDRPDGAKNLQLQFIFAGDADQDGYTDYDWFWAFDNVVVEGLQSVSFPDTPELTAPAEVRGVQDISITASAYHDPENTPHKSTQWQVALDRGFTQMLIPAADDDVNLTSLTLPASIAPWGSTIYVRAQYVNENGNRTDFSAISEIQVLPPEGVRLLSDESFNDVAVGSIPDGWSVVSFNGGESGDPVYDNAASWEVVDETTLGSFGGDRVNIAVYDGNSIYVNSDGFDPYQESHLFSPSFDFSNTTNVYLAYWSNYVQNQDNIGVVEYTTDGGGLSDAREVSGTWNPVVYMLDDDSQAEDIIYTDDTHTTVDVAATLAAAADGANLNYGDYVFAPQSQDLAPYFSGRIDDNKTESKRFEKFRLDKADGQANVKIRWMNMGTNSWFWGLDNIQIWGDDGQTSVPDWSLF